MRLGFAVVVVGAAIMAGSLPTGTAAAIAAQDSRSMIEPAAVASTSTERTNTDWKVQAGRAFQRAGEYTVGRYHSGDHLQDAIDAYGPPSSCKLKSPVGDGSHAVATWALRGIRIYTAGYGVPAGETACTSPGSVYVSQIRLTDRRWTTSYGLHVGDPTTKLRRLYPKSTYDPGLKWNRTEFTIVWQRVHCDLDCSAYERVHGTDIERLMAQVMNGRVIAFWVPVFGEGE